MCHNYGNWGKAILLMAKMRKILHTDLSSILCSVTVLRVQGVLCSNLVLAPCVTNLNFNSE